MYICKCYMSYTINKNTNIWKHTKEYMYIPYIKDIKYRHNRQDSLKQKIQK